MSEPAPVIVILGGGTAGWMAACLFAHAWPAARITLVESPEIGIVGVGEGSTPQLAAFFLNAWLSRHHRVALATDYFPFAQGYGYHFDAHLVGQVLRDHAVVRGVTHLQRRIDDVAVGADGQVIRLVAQGGERIAGDLFVGSSGFRSAIAQGALGVRFLPFADNLFNDRAVTIPTPRTRPTPAHTTATALTNGWAWRIPLSHRTGNGYVYSSRHLDPDVAETELRPHLGVSEDVPARHLAMKVGRVETSWTGNCLAIGLAQGFIEPLEATALHIVQATVEEFIAAWSQAGFTPKHRDHFNARIARRYEGVRDYIVAHYRLNRRSDTAYWRDNARHDRLSDSLKALMTSWFTGRDFVAEIEHQGIADIHAPLSWGCLFAGYGTFPERLRPAAALTDLDRFIERCGANYPTHDAVLDAMEPRNAAALEMA